MIKQIGRHWYRLAIAVAILFLPVSFPLSITPCVAQAAPQTDGTADTSGPASVSTKQCNTPQATPLENLLHFVTGGGASAQPRTTKAESRMYHLAWAAMHNQHVQRAKKGNIGAVFYGDSITELMAEDRPLFDKYFSKYRGEPFGIGGDKTEQLLWRLQNGELDGFVPKVAVVLIGTNNLSGDPEHDVAQGVDAVLCEIKKRSPKTKILLLGLLPRQQSAKDPMRARVKKVNQELSGLADQKSIWYQDIGDRLVDKDGNIPDDIMPDFLHPSPKGYQIIYEAIQPQVAKLYE